MGQKAKEKDKSTSRPLWTPYYERIVRNRKKYTRKQKHKKNWKDWE